MIEKYGETDVTNIENPQILSLNPFAQIAKRPRIMKGIFKSPEEYNEADAVDLTDSSESHALMICMKSC